MAQAIDWLESITNIKRNSYLFLRVNREGLNSMLCADGILNIGYTHSRSISSFFHGVLDFAAPPRASSPGGVDLVAVTFPTVLTIWTASSAADKPRIVTL